MEKKKELTKELPAALPLEEAVLGALLLDKEAIYTISSLLKPHHFAVKPHHLIFAAILELYDKAEAIDLLTVADKLKATGELETVGGPYYLVELTNRVASSENIEYHCKIILQQWMRREGIVKGYQFINDCFNSEVDVFEAFNKQEAAVEAVKGANLGHYQQSNFDILKRLRDRIVKNREKGGLGVPLFGIESLDGLLQGAEEDDYILIAGRPSMGKSSLTNAAVVYAVRNNIPSLFWSMEMTNENTIARAWAALAEVDYNRLMRGDITEPEEVARLQAAEEELATAPVFFEETVGINVRDFKSKIVTMKKKHDLQAVFLDRIGLLDNLPETKNKSTSDQLAESSKIIRQMAIKLKLPMIILSQLNREVEKRPLKIPKMADLRNSGSLEQDATKIILLYRPEYYGIDDFEGEPTEGLAFFIVPKNRNGKTDTVKAVFKPQFMTFVDEEDLDFKESSTPAADFIKPNRTDKDVPF